MGAERLPLRDEREPLQQERRQSRRLRQENLPLTTVPPIRRAMSPMELYDYLPFGVVFVDVTGAVMEMNRAARELLCYHGSLVLLGGYLVPALHGQAAEMRRLLFDVIHGASRTGSMVVESPTGEEPLEVMVSAVVDSSASAMIFLNDASREVAPDASFLRETFRMSPAEVRLTERLLSGASLDEAAHTLGVTLNTVRTHLKSIFLKTGARRQSDLLRRVSNSLASVVRF